MFRRLLSNWPYKLFSIMAAIMLTSYVHSELNPMVTASVTAVVKAEHLKEGYVAAPKLDTIRVTLKGPKADLDSVVNMAKSGEVIASIDLGKFDEGTYQVPIARVKFPEKLPDSIYETLSVSQISVHIESKTSRTMPVGVKISSSLPAGWAAGSANISPSTATVSGPSSLVDSVERLVVVAEPSTSRPVVDEYVGISAVDASGQEVSGVRVAPDVAHVGIKLVAAPGNKSIFISPTVIGQPEFPYKVTRVTVSPSSVTARGRLEDLERIGTIMTDAVDISGNRSDVVARVRLQVPPGLDIEGSSYVRVVVRIESAGTTPP